MYDSFDNTYQVRLNTSTFNFNNHWWCLISTAILIGNDCEYLVDSFFSGHNRNWFPVKNYVSWRQNSKFIFVTSSNSVFVFLLLVQLLFFSHWTVLFLTHTETAFVHCYCDQECCIPLDNPPFLCSFPPSTWVFFLSFLPFHLLSHHRFEIKHLTWSRAEGWWQVKGDYFFLPSQRPRQLALSGAYSLPACTTCSPFSLFIFSH